MQRVVNIIIILFFIIAISLPALFINFFGDASFNAGNQKRLNLPELIDGQGIWKADASTLFSAWFDKNLGFRIPLNNIYTFIEYRLFGVSPGNNVDTGQNSELSHTSKADS